MQRMLDAVTHGYVWHTGGFVPLLRAPHLADKFADRYSVHWNANQRAYAKRKGKANAHLYFLARGEADHLDWWLLVTPGKGRVYDDENLRLITNRRYRLRIGDDYEIIRRTRTRQEGGGQVWTWRMTHTCHEMWRERIIQACRSKSHASIKQIMSSLYRAPGFSGVRQQVGILVALARREWCRRHGETVVPGERPRLSYIERIPDQTVVLSELLLLNGFPT